MMSKFLLLWLYVVIHISHRHNNIIIAEDCVSQKKNTNNCTTFEKIIKDGKNLLHNFTLIVDGPVQLNISLCFNNLSDLTLVGKNKGTISCSNQNAGVSFYNVTGLTIKSLVFRHCGLLLKSTGTNSSSYPPREKRTHWQYRTAVYIELCSDITIEKSAFVENYGVGLSIYDPISTVDVVECNFTANRISPPESDTFSGGGGMHVELTSCAPGIYSYERSSCDRAISEQKNVSFTISSCMFENNNSTTIEYSDGYGTLNSGFYQRFGRGGGLIFVAEANVRFTYLTLTDCVFNNNSAEWGGGMLVLFTGMSSSSNLIAQNCTFGNNTGRRGGGGVYLQLSDTTNNNFMEFQLCDFSNNSAKIGGGFLLLSNENYQSVRNQAVFHCCTWTSNSAKYSAAVDLSRPERSAYTRHALIPKFINCSFTHNYLVHSTTEIAGSSVNYSVLGKGTFMALYFTIVFQTYVCFENNSGSALYLLSSNASFSSGITAIFRRNHGITGGAFSLKASSVININPNSTFQLHDNTASSVGGAIYYNSIGEHELHDQTNNCMFNIASTIDDVTLNFSGNTQRNNVVNSVYSSPLNACVEPCSVNTSTTSKTLLSCNYYVTFYKDTPLQIQGTGTNIALIQDRNLSEPLQVFPGISYKLPFYLVDARNNNQSGSFLTEIVSSSSNVEIDRDYIYSTGNQIKLIGMSGGIAKVRFTRTDHFHFEVTFDIKLLPCPPGLNLDSDNRKCVCRLDNAFIYHMITCGSGGQKALIVSGFWGGYVDSTNPRPDRFVTAQCPFGFCTYYENSDQSVYSLPQNLSTDNISSFMCGQTRTGILCGDCVEGHSVFYHSPMLECKQHRLCKIGWLFYIVSELLPLTILFILIMAFNVKFTAGNVNGFIFYSQVVSSLSISSHGISRISLSNAFNVLAEIHLFIHRSFNMEFFVINNLSFCLWEGATTLDIMAFSYITILYAFLLVILTMLIMKYFSCCLRWCHQRNTTSYVIHGLSTFLILCYVRCTQVSFKILTSSSLVGANLEYTNRRRVFYSGNHQYFDEHHVIYAIPALVCIIIIVTIPPALLIWYPAGPKLLQKCGIGDSMVLKLLNKLVPLYKLQPLFDSFQSCYRDNCRYFSGLYFLYRTSIVAAFAGSMSVQQYFFSIQIVLAAMLALHAIAQPYKNRWHNIIDTSILAILSAINAVSGLIVSKQVHLNAITRRSIVNASRFQLVLIYLPLISLLTYGTLKAIAIIKAKCKCKTRELTDFSARLIHSDNDTSDEISKGYKPPKGQSD